MEPAVKLALGDMRGVRRSEWHSMFWETVAVWEACYRRLPDHRLDFDGLRIDHREPGDHEHYELLG